MCTLRFSAPPEPLHDCDGAAAHITETALPGTGAQMAEHLAQQHPHDHLAQVVAPSEQVADPMRQREHPLPYRDIRDDVIHQMRRTLGHSASATARTEPSTLARERDQALGLTANAPEPREPSGEPPTGQECLKLLFDESRHAFAVAQVRRLGEERLQVSADDAM